MKEEEYSQWMNRLPRKKQKLEKVILQDSKKESYEPKLHKLAELDFVLKDKKLKNNLSTRRNWEIGKEVVIESEEIPDLHNKAAESSSSSAESSENSNAKPHNSDTKETHIFKRLAAKYNPRPRKNSVKDILTSPVGDARTTVHPLIDLASSTNVLRNSSLKDPKVIGPRNAKDAAGHSRNIGHGHPVSNPRFAEHSAGAIRNNVLNNHNSQDQNEFIPPQQRMVVHQNTLYQDNSFSNIDCEANSNQMTNPVNVPYQTPSTAFHSYGPIESTAIGEDKIEQEMKIMFGPEDKYERAIREMFGPDLPSNDDEDSSDESDDGRESRPYVKDSKEIAKIKKELESYVKNHLKVK